jgi:penicillin amidase
MVDVLSKSQLTPDETNALDELKGWNYVDSADSIAPAIFQATWDTLYNLVWDEFVPESKTAMEGPSLPTTVKYLKEFPNDSLMDIQSTPEKETAPDLIKMAFKAGVAQLDQWKKEHKGNLTWSNYKATKVAHWARIEPFSVANVHNGGYKHIINATDSKNGPSWRMIVSLEKGGIKAWAIYPGGQSGNPGSPFYANRIPEWANGQYHQLHFLKKDEQPGKKFFSETFQPTH